MGGTGGTSSIYTIVNGQTIQIPLPTDGSLVDSVLLYNYSPFLVQVRIGTANAWLSAWMVERITLGNASGVACTAVQPVGGAASTSTGNITAAFILKGDDLSDVGTYPAPLFHVNQFLNIYYPDGDIAIAIGPGEEIQFFDDITGAVQLLITPGTTEWINSNNTGMIWINANGGFGTGGWPEIDFFSANTPGGYMQPAFINAVADGAGNPQIGINSTLYTFGSIGIRDRLWLSSGAIFLDIINTLTQAELNAIQLTPTNTFSIFPLQTGTWQNLTLQNSWTNFGTPYSNAQYRLASDGFIHLRGLVTTGTRADGTIIATLPSGFFPPAQKYLSTTSNVANLSISNPQIVVDTSGNIKIFGISGYSSAVQIVLDGLLFESLAYMS